MRAVAIIPARGGSRRLPRKNVRPLAGRPMIAWTIDAALHVPAIDRVIVSTDDDEVAACAIQFGAEVPVRRPPELARDDTPGVVPVLHMVEWLEAHEQYRPDAVLLLQPTSPLRTAEDIEASLAAMTAHGSDSVVSVTPLPFPADWIREIDGEGRLRQPAAALGRTAVVLNGAIYGAIRTMLLATRSTYGASTRAYIMPADRSIDVDSAVDFQLAECLMLERMGVARPQPTRDGVR
jgi:CMP-N,N'-diacetyllegionaminic acid synthase